MSTLDLGAIREQFPGLHQDIRGQRLVYLDSAATTQMPRAVLEAVRRFDEHDRANVHRGVHTLSARATEAYEGARRRVARFLGAATDELVFVRGTTEAINLVAASWGGKHLRPGDEVLVTTMEHHSNLVPWQLVCERTGATLKAVPMNARGELDLERLSASGDGALLGPRTRMVAVAHVSNALGTVNPIAAIVELAHARGALVLVDGAQAAPHLPVNVARLGCDFYVGSGHKLYGPMGIGFLWGRAELLADMPPYQGGGGMIRSVRLEKTTFAPPPERFEAGTPNVSGAVGLAAAVDWLAALGMEAVAAHERQVLQAAERALAQVPGVQIIGTAADKVGVCSFTLEPIHPHDLGTVLDSRGVAVRAGHHCAQPAMEHFGVPATLRASFGIYNGADDVTALVDALGRAREVFKL